MKYKNKIIAAIVILIILAIAFAFGGKEKPKALENTAKVTEAETAENKPIEAIKADEVNEAEIASEEKPQNADNTPMTAEEKIEYAENHVEANNDFVTGENLQTENPKPVEPENAVVTAAEKTCTLSVRCDTVLDNISWLDKEKVGIIPENGVIFPEQQVIFYDGESVFNVLLREMKKNKIHLEFVNTPVYNSAYIEGIANLYEFDCGELSGWMYKVNGWFPNYGCSQYRLQDGDKVEWVYTCNLGADVGGNYSTKNGSG